MLLRLLVGAGSLIALLLTSTLLHGQAAVPRLQAQRIDAFPEPFSLVRGLRELPTGGVLVTDWIEERLVALDFTRGTMVAIGRVGGGPREFRLPAQLLPYTGDSTLLVDVGNERFAVVGPDLAIHRTLRAQVGNRPYTITPRGADTAGRLYFGIPPWALGPNAPPGDSVDVARWDPRTDDVQILTRLKGSERTSWQKEGRPRMTPGIPMVVFAPQDAWAIAVDGRIAVVRAGDYHVEWRAADGTVRHGRSYAYAPLAVTAADKRAFVIAFTQSSPMSGRGADGRLGHTPAEFLSPERIEEDIRTNEFAERHPYFRAGGAWMAPDGALWVERSVAAGAAPVLDVFDQEGRLVRQVTLPAGRRLVGFGRGVLYAVAADDDGLETLERYRAN
jgi:hypothetical protein